MKPPDELEGVEEDSLVGLCPLEWRCHDVGQLCCCLPENQSNHHSNYNLSTTESGSVLLCEEGEISKAETDSEGGSAVPRQRVEGSRVNVDVLPLDATLDGLSDGPSWILRTVTIIRYS